VDSVEDNRADLAVRVADLGGPLLYSRGSVRFTISSGARPRSLLRGLQSYGDSLRSRRLGRVLRIVSDVTGPIEAILTPSRFLRSNTVSSS